MVYISDFLRLREQRTGIRCAIDILGVVLATSDRHPHLEENVLILIIAEAVTAVVDVVGFQRLERFGFGLVDFGRVSGVEALTFVIDSLR